MSDVFLTGADRDYVLGRLDRDHIEKLAESARHELSVGNTVELYYCPGDGTWYSLILSCVKEVMSAPGGGTQGNVSSYIGGEGTFTCIHSQSERATYFQPEEDMVWVAARFGMSAASTLAVAELLKEVFQSGDN